MAHPQMYEHADPYLGRLRAICLALPGADEKVSHGRPNFFTRKVFAIYGGVLKGDHDQEPFRQALIVQPDENDRAALLEDPRFVVPGYYGPYGWLMLDLRNDRAAEGSTGTRSPSSSTRPTVARRRSGWSASSTRADRRPGGRSR